MNSMDSMNIFCHGIEFPDIYEEIKKKLTVEDLEKVNLYLTGVQYFEFN